MKRLFVVVNVLILLGFYTFVFAAAPDPGPGGPCGAHGFRGPTDHGHRLQALLNLTAEQKAKIEELRNRFHADTRDLKYDLIQKRIEMKKLFTDPKVGDAALLAKEKEISGIVQKLIDKKVQLKIDERKLLTAEQIRKLDMMPPGHGMRHGMGHGMGGPCGDPEMMGCGGMH